MINPLSNRSKCNLVKNKMPKPNKEAARSPRIGTKHSAQMNIYKNENVLFCVIFTLKQCATHQNPAAKFVLLICNFTINLQQKILLTFWKHFSLLF